MKDAPAKITCLVFYAATLLFACEHWMPYERRGLAGRG